MTPTIRVATIADADAIRGIYAPYCESTSISFEYTAPTTAAMAERVASITARFPWLVLEDDEGVAGYAYASSHRERAAYGWSVDTAVYVRPRAHRSGVGRALYTALLQLLRLQGYVKAHAGITLPNVASVGLHEAMGFRLVGVYKGVGYKFGQWLDVAWYQAQLQPERANPSPPVAAQTLAQSAEWAHALAEGLAYYRGSGTV